MPSLRVYEASVLMSDSAETASLRHGHLHSGLRFDFILGVNAGAVAERVGAGDAGDAMGAVGVNVGAADERVGAGAGVVKLAIIKGDSGGGIGSLYGL